jgi:hypothetical protein
LKKRGIDLSLLDDGPPRKGKGSSDPRDAKNATNDDPGG